MIFLFTNREFGDGPRNSKSECSISFTYLSDIVAGYDLLGFALFFSSKQKTARALSMHRSCRFDDLRGIRTPDPVPVKDVFSR